MRKMCATLCAILACVILFLSILATVQCLPLDNSPATSADRKTLPTQDDESDIPSGSGGGLDTQQKATEELPNLNWWQIEKKSSGMKETETLVREKRFPRIPIGPQCRTHQQCSATHCCAMKLGMPVCRIRPNTPGQPCQQHSSMNIQPDTSQLFTYCPCAEGLTCQRRRRGSPHKCFA